MSILAELQRRSVFKVGAVYLVVGWLLIQIAATVFPSFGIPDWALRLTTLLVLLGFPVALVLAWAFELTPEGVKVETGGVGSKRMFAVAAVLVAITLGWWLRAPSGGAEPEQVEARSIAVLPFQNMSGDQQNEYFSDGISEEILNSLAQMPELKVAARTSSFSFKGQSKEIPDIARELEVRMVLEGSVRKQGERVRITAQLIDARKGFHIWSQTYDRDLKDIFAIQDEIAHAIANELKIKLAAVHDDGGRPDTTDLVAYDEYLKAMQLWQAREEPNLREADRLFRSALARDPDFAKAWAGVALVWTVLPEWSTEPLVPAWAIARDAAEHATALDPTLPEPLAALGYIAMGEFRFATGRALFARVHALAPSYATGYQWHGEGLAYAGDFLGAAAQTRKATQLDRKSGVVQLAYTNQLWGLEREDEIVEICTKVVADLGGWHNCELNLHDIALMRRDWPTARRWLRGLAAKRGEAAAKFADDMVDAAAGERPVRPIAEKLAGLPDGSLDPRSLSPMSDLSAAFWLLQAGFPELAVQRLLNYTNYQPHYVRVVMFDPHFAALHCLPSFARVAAKVQVDAAHVARMCERSKQPRQPKLPKAPRGKS
jgi:TolB-like protein